MVRVFCVSLTSVNSVFIRGLNCPGGLGEWCRGQELNLHGLPHRLLRPACLPFHHPGWQVSVYRIATGRRGATGPATLTIRGRTPARAAGTFVMINSSTGPRAEGRELMARRAGTPWTATFP